MWSWKQMWQMIQDTKEYPALQIAWRSFTQWVASVVNKSQKQYWDLRSISHEIGTYENILYSSHFRRCLCNSKIDARYDDGACHKIALPPIWTPCWYVGHIVFFSRNLRCVGSMSGGTFLMECTFLMESMPGYPLPISPHILPMLSFCSLCSRCSPY